LFRDFTRPTRKEDASNVDNFGGSDWATGVVLRKGGEVGRGGVFRGYFSSDFSFCSIINYIFYILREKLHNPVEMA